MTRTRVLHVDDEPDIREVVRISLALDEGLAVRSCSSGAEALAVAGEWQPDLVLLDVMMPDMDGPTTLSELHKDARTAGLTVVFMTARAQSRELDYFKSLGAVGVIAKPFDPISLAGSVRSFLRPTPPALDGLRDEFLDRAARESREISACAKALEAGDQEALARVKQLAHGLAGAAGIFGYARISDDAAALEEAIISGQSLPVIKVSISALLAGIAESVRDHGKAAVVPPFGGAASVTSH